MEDVESEVLKLDAWNESRYMVDLTSVSNDSGRQSSSVECKDGAGLLTIMIKPIYPHCDPLLVILQGCLAIALLRHMHKLRSQQAAHHFQGNIGSSTTHERRPAVLVWPMVKSHISRFIFSRTCWRAAQGPDFQTLH